MREHVLALLIGTTVILGSGGSVAQADHVCRRFHLDAFEDANRQLNQELEARREALRCAFEEQRDAFHAEIRGIERHLRGRQRADAVRVLHRSLEDVDRAYHRNLRSLHEEIDDRRRHLIHQRDDALRHCRTTHCTEACYAGVEVVVPRLEYRPAPLRAEPIPAPHQSAPGQPALPAPEHGPELLPRGTFRGGPRQYFAERALQHPHHGESPATHPAHSAHPREEFDWQSLVLDLIERRLNR